MSLFDSVYNLLQVWQTKLFKIYWAKLCGPGVKYLNSLSSIVSLVLYILCHGGCEFLKQCMKDLKEKIELLKVYLLHGLQCKQAWESQTSTNMLWYWTLEIQEKESWYRRTLGWEKASRFILLKCFDEPPSTTYDAKVKGAPTKPRTAASLFTWQIKSTVELTNSECINKIWYTGTFSTYIKDI